MLSNTYIKEIRMEEITKNIEMVRSFDSKEEVKNGDYFKLVTEQTSGFIPINFKKTFLDSGFFKLSDEDPASLRFLFNDSAFKTKAIESVTELLIEQGLIERANVPRKQERHIGGADRLEEPEFIINRAYDGYWGFQLDGVVMLAYKVDDQTNKPLFLLQERSNKVVFGNSYDFTAGGAIVSPQTVSMALEAQMQDEMGLTVSQAQKIQTLEYSYTRPTSSKQIMRLRQSVYASKVEDTNPIYHNFEVDGFIWADAEKILELVRDERIAASHVPVLISTLDKLGVLPEFENKSETLQKMRDLGLVKDHHNEQRNVTSKSILKRHI